MLFSPLIISRTVATDAAASFHGSLQRALTRRGFPRENMQAWLDDYRWEHNYIRPHEALNMKTPASVIV
jgi:transposase InsO family protein